jgi:hypothetical protein
MLVACATTDGRLYGRRPGLSLTHPGQTAKLGQLPPERPDGRMDVRLFLENSTVCLDVVDAVVHFLWAWCRWGFLVRVPVGWRAL